MRIAVATDDNKFVYGHVGRCKNFLIIDVENGQILKKELRINNLIVAT